MLASPTGKSEENFQTSILRAYTILRLLRADWGGALILGCSLEPPGAAVAMGANIAGAVSLSVEVQPELLKVALHSGCCDFVVNTFDEALRIMKNEARKHQPISVGLLGEVRSVLSECLERGVQPELIVDPKMENREAAQQLQRRGATVVYLNESAPGNSDFDASATVDNFVQRQQWDLHSLYFKDAAALRSFDVCAFELLTESDTLRRQWLRSASRIVQRQRPLSRSLWMTEEERKTLSQFAVDQT